MNEQQQLVSPLGLTVAAIADEMRGLYYQLLQEQPPEVAPDTLARWRQGVEFLFSMVEAEHGSITAACMQFTHLLGLDYSEMKAVPRLAWQATIRHGLNLITAGTQFDVADTRDELRAELTQVRNFNWKTWIANQLEKSQ